MVTSKAVLGSSALRGLTALALGLFFGLIGVDLLGLDEHARQVEHLPGEAGRREFLGRAQQGRGDLLGPFSRGALPP